jgi:hypothetical protein
MATGGLGGSASFRILEQKLDESALAPEAKAGLKQEVQNVKEDIQSAIYYSDRVFYRIVVVVLGLAILGVVCAITVLLFNGVTGFDALTAIGSAAVGGLVGLLAPSPVGRNQG